MALATQTPAPDCMIMEQWAPPPSQVISVRELRGTFASCGRNKERTAESDHSLRQNARKRKKMPTMDHSGSEDGSWEGPSAAEKEVTPSPNMRKFFGCRSHDF